MGEVLSFKKPMRLGGRVRDVPFKEVAWQIARLLDLHHEDSLACQLKFDRKGHVTIIIGWPATNDLEFPYDLGPMAELEEILTIYERGIDNGTEENPALVTFYQASASDCPASWALASEESVKFPLRDCALRNDNGEVD